MKTLQYRRYSRLVRFVGAVALSVATTACGSGGGAPVTPSPSASVSPPPSAPSPTVPVVVESPAPLLRSRDPGNPVVTPSPSLDLIPRDSIATIVTDDLRVRSKPGVSDGSKLLEPLLDQGRQVFVIDGPVEASGYAWYLIAPLGILRYEELPVGWVAVADKTGETWVEPRAAECPQRPTTLVQMTTLEPLIALACFGDEEIEFTAQAIRPEATCGAEPGWTIQPDWLGSTCPQPDFILTGEGSDDHMYTLIEPGTLIDDIDPGVVPEDSVDVVVRGHFDHAASSSCRVDVYVPESGDPGVTPEGAVVICRLQFVITSLEAAG